MERKQGGCCLAPRCGGDGGQGQAWQMGNILLKFRPIAPKPAAMAPAPVTAPATAAGARKGKRKAAAAGRRGRKTKKAAAVAAVKAAPPPTPKADVGNDKPLPSPSPSSSGTTSVADSSSPPPPPVTLMHASSPDKADLAPAHLLGHVAALRPAPSCVTVEAVTATWSDGASAPSAPACGGEDEDAPAFVSDRWGRVTWTNLAFSRAASASDVVLAARDGAAVPAWGACAGFTCRVRVTHASPRRGSLVAPCDVWRVGDGGYLWRLDLRTTLTLSLGGLV